jgi:hypothetical protein
MASNINAGTQQFGEVTNPTGLAGSITQDPFTPVEAGDNSAKSKYTTTASTGAPIEAAVKTAPVKKQKVNTDG